jgi:hypothetical protein
MLTRGEIFPNNTSDSISDSEEESDGSEDEPIIHHAQMTKVVSNAPYSSANNTTSSSITSDQSQIHQHLHRILYQIFDHLKHFDRY